MMEQVILTMELHGYVMMEHIIELWNSYIVKPHWLIPGVCYRYNVERVLFTLVLIL